MKECDWYYYIYPSIWNKLKFHLYRGMNLVYNGDLPQYVVDFCDKVSVNLIPYKDVNSYNLEEQFFEIKENWKDDKNFLINVNLDDLWEESWDDIIDEKTCYIECNPYNICTTLYGLRDYKFHSIQKGWLELGYNIVPLFWKEMIPSLRDEQIELIEHFNDIALASVEDYDKITCRMSIFPTSKDEITTHKYIHIISSDGGTPLNVYRRCFLNDVLKKKYGDDLATNAFLGINKANLCVVSHPTYYIPECDKLLYDRSDNWNGSNIDSNDENAILSKADCVICSSKWLYNDTVEYIRLNRANDDVEIKYIPNGNMMFNYPTNVEKFETPTAIYAGARIKKTDLQLIYLLCEMNPDWNFMIYGEGATELLSIPDNLYVHELISLEELFPIICKCHIGLCLIKPNDWSLGMLPNKIFNYINARIPTIYSGIPDINVEDYSQVVFNISDISSLNDVMNLKISDETYDSLKRDWKDVCTEVMSCIDKLEKKEK